MPFAYQIDIARRLVISRARGTLTDQDLLSHAAALARDLRFRPDMRQLADFREVTKIEIATGTVRQMAGLNPFRVGSRRAFVVGTEGAYGLARMYQILRDRDPDELEVFRALEPALEWLGLSQDAADVKAALTALRPSPQ